MNLQHSTNTNVVRDKNLLERRLNYYINSGRGGRQNETAFINALSKCARLYVFGGLIRDISLYTAHQFCSDIDLVFSGTKKQLQETLKKYGIEKISENKFGGFRVKDFTIDIDIWSLEETWAFKQNFIVQEDVKSLLNTTLMSWDSVLYDIEKNKIITKDSWLTDLRIGRLDLVLEETPDEISALVRILRTIYGKQVTMLGERLCSFLSIYLDKYSTNILINHEYHHFGTNYITNLRQRQLKKNLDKWHRIGDMQLDELGNDS
ncbi:hypothetical protein [Proteus sp. CD3]|uniref:hypothetical protein n=1 Tax=Proteus sp. CD3 TaxID=1921565 RepID=UPI00124A185D|nr:hypothetical protein [Proteus sp. CD3]QEZ93820.1 hypothetical protein BTA34_16355 [Proteus sp. CD3]